MSKPSELLASRIAAERERLAAAELAESANLAARKSALSNDDDAQIDAADLAIDQARTVQVRCLERIELLEADLAAAQRVERDADLDAIVERANRLRVRGEKLIKERYAKEAAALAKTLQDLLETEAAVTWCNQRLSAAGRTEVPMPEAIRNRPAELVETFETIRVGPNDTRHPQYGKTFYNYSDRTKPPRYMNLEQTAEIFPVDIRVPKKRHVPGSFPRDLTRDVNLPCAAAQALGERLQDYWTRDEQQHTRSIDLVDQARIDALFDEVDTAATKAKSSWLKSFR